jgi:hypothetical protein
VSGYPGKRVPRRPSLQRALGGAVAIALAAAVAACQRTASIAPPSPEAGRPDVARAAHDGLPAGVVDPWAWPRAAGATDRDRALEDIGPYEPLEPERAGSPLCSPNAHYWTALVGIAWDRDVVLDFDDEPVDLDGDGRPDMRLTRHVRAPGGVLANPELFGLVRTPDDPRGRVGRVSASTGVLGLREALAPDGGHSGEIGMTCFACHGGADPADGHVVLGMAGTAFDYGLLLATAAILAPDGAAAAYRRAHGFPDGRSVRARLLLAGPGRQDLTGEFGLDITVPGIHSMRYAGTRRVRQGTKGIVNPISIPPILPWAGVDLQNWSGSELASVRLLQRLLTLGGGGQAGATETLARLELPPADAGDLHASAATRRALLFDLRNLGTLGLQQDAFAGLLWADAITGAADREPPGSRSGGGATALALDRAALFAIPRLFATASLRRVIAAEALAPATSRATRDAASVARGRVIFTERFVGRIANRQLLKEAPARYAPAKLAGPVLAPLDEALPAVIDVRCADCHNATPGGAKVALSQAPPPFGRCSHCHHAHAPFAEDGEATAGAPRSAPPARLPLDRLGVPAAAEAEVRICGGCHETHRPFGPVVYSSSLLLPLDANENGRAQDDEAADAAAGGLGTEALLAFDVPRPERPATGFALQVPALARLYAPGPIDSVRLGAGWVRVPPLLGIRASAPYLHNGSVPTLRALLDPPAKRPATFPLGTARFVLDTRVPGNRNIGHEFGTHLSPREKSDLVTFLQSL